MFQTVADDDASSFAARQPSVPRPPAPGRTRPHQAAPGPHGDAPGTHQAAPGTHLGRTRDNSVVNRVALIAVLAAAIFSVTVFFVLQTRKPDDVVRAREVLSPAGTSGTL